VHKCLSGLARYMSSTLVDALKNRCYEITDIETLIDSRTIRVRFSEDYEF